MAIMRFCPRDLLIDMFGFFGAIMPIVETGLQAIPVGQGTVGELMLKETALISSAFSYALFKDINTNGAMLLSEEVHKKNMKKNIYVPA